MMVSGVRTSSGFEERIRFAELEIVDRDAIDTGVLSTVPEGNYVNGWEDNSALKHRGVSRDVFRKGVCRLFKDEGVNVLH